MPSIATYRSKLRGMKLGRIVRMLRPHRVDELLFELAPVRESTFPFRRFSADERSGHRAIDERLRGERLCYACFDADQLAHMSWVFFDTLLPSRFGFDPSIPVIGDCETRTRFRGRGLYPEALRYIVHDLAARNIARRCYVLVSPNNHASIRGIEKAGGRPLARLRGLQVVGQLIWKDRDGSIAAR